MHSKLSYLLYRFSYGGILWSPVIRPAPWPPALHHSTTAQMHFLLRLSHDPISIPAVGWYPGSHWVTGMGMNVGVPWFMHLPTSVSPAVPWVTDGVCVTVFNCEPHSASSASKVSFWKRHFGTASEFPVPFRTWKGQRYFGNDRNRFWKVLAPFRTQNRRKHSNRLTISYVRLNLWLPFITAPITIHYKLHSGPSGGLIRVYLRPWYIYVYPTYKHLSCLCPSKIAAEVSFSFHLVFTSS